MASRESQGLQIALIIFVMVTVVLAVLTFVFYRRSEALKKTVVDAEQKEKAARDNYDMENFKVQYLKHILGAAPLSDAEFNLVKQSVLTDEDMKTIDDLYQQHMATYGEPYQAGEPITNYRDLLPNLLMALRERNVANTNLSEQVNQLNAANQKLKQDENERTQQAVDNLEKARNDLASRTQDFEKQRDALAGQQQSQLASFKKAIGEEQAKVAASERTDEQRQAQMKKMQVVIQQQQEVLTNVREDTFESPDGQVLWVNQRARTAWVNLGSADGLRRQTLFSVYGQEANGVTRTERKASVEVTRVLDEHLAEARIVFDDAADPVLPGDQIFSPAWQPGQRVHFALAGRLDIDGDGKGDRELLRNLIANSGAVVDAEVTDAGESSGAVTPDTRYLVRGDPPTDLTDAKVRAAWNKINEDASQLGVEIITLDKLLSWMGYKAEFRTVPLGRGARAEDARSGPAQGKAPTSTGNVSDIFEKRVPAGGAGSDSPF